MKPRWQRLLRDETGFVVSSELVIVSTVGVLAMVVGLESVSSSVIQELNDLSGAFGAISQTFNVRGLQKGGHARINGFGFFDQGDFCDCGAVAPSDVVGFSGSSRVMASGGLILEEPATAVCAQSVVIGSATVQDVVSPGTVIEEVVIPPASSAVKTETRVISPDPQGEIIEERIIKRRVNPPVIQDVPSTPAPAKPGAAIKPPSPPKIQTVKPNVKHPESKAPDSSK